MYTAVRRNDLLTIWAILVPAGVAAAGIYAAGAAWPAAFLLMGAFVLSVLIAPEIGLYAYFGIQALDVLFITGEQVALTPSKALAVFLLAVYLVRPAGVRSPILLSKPCIAAGLLLGLGGMLTAPFALDHMLALRSGAQIVVQVLLIIVAIQTLNHQGSVAAALFCTVLGGTVASGLMLVGGVSTQFGRGTLGEFANPNTTALGLSVAGICLPAAWAHNRTRLLYVFYMLAGPLILAAVVKTGSRSALVAIVGALIICVFLAKGTKFFARLLLPLVGVGIVLTSVFVALESGSLDRKSQVRIQELLGGWDVSQVQSRTEIWSLALETYASRPWGFGFGNTAATIGERRGYYIDAHSSYVSVLVEGGPVLFGLFLFLLWQLLRRSRRTVHGGHTLSVPILIIFLLLSCVTHTIHMTKWFWIPATLCLMLVEQAERQRREMAQLECQALSENGGYSDVL